MQVTDATASAAAAAAPVAEYISFPFLWYGVMACVLCMLVFLILEHVKTFVPLPMAVQKPTVRLAGILSPAVTLLLVTVYQKVSCRAVIS